MGNSLGGGDGVVEEHPRAGGVLWIVPRGRPSRVQPTLAPGLASYLPYQ
jgi:hypothetical protein